MKKYLKAVIKNLTLAIGYLNNKFKLYMINQALYNVLQQLIDIKHEKISDVELLDEKLFFRYLGGRFFVIPQIVSNNTKVGQLTVYHETILEKDNKRPVENFYLEVDMLGNVKITNYESNQVSELLKSLVHSNLITVYPDEISSTFVKHFEAKMKNEPSIINPS